MLTRKNLNKQLKGIISELSSLGISVERMVLFGSYAKGIVHEKSDMDVAIWSPQLSGLGLIDLEKYRPLLRRFPNVDIKTFSAGTSKQDDPFIEVIESTGIEIPLHEEEAWIK